MSASNVIGDITKTLEVLLREQQRPLNLFAVTHNSPAQEAAAAPTAPTVSLYLYRVVENPNAKNQDWLPIGNGLLRKPPLALNLHYLMTPFAGDELDEHRILGEAMRIFYDNAIIEAPLLQDSLAHSEEEFNIDLGQCSLEELARIWNSSDRPYRLSVCYEVRMVLIDSAIETPITRVLEKENRFEKHGRLP